MFPRLVNPLKTKSFFIFGARATGKSTFLHELFKDELDVAWIDLLDPSWERRVRNDPESILKIGVGTKSKRRWVVIDEIQKFPALLDSVQRSMLNDKNTLFALTGSSARKLKRSEANMLAGRALSYSMFPLTSFEIGAEFQIQRALEAGTLPESLASESPRETKKFLEAYCQTYMKEEVFAEQLARRLEPFRFFLECAAQDNGHIVNYDSIGRKIGVSGKTVANFYSILAETYLGILLYPSHASFRKKIAQKPKFYFFDTGIQRSLADTVDIPLVESTNAYGDTFEHWVILEAFRLNTLAEKNYTLGFLEAHGGVTIDLVLEKARRPSLFIEIKSAKQVSYEHLKHLRAMQKIDPTGRFICLSRDDLRRTEGGIEIIPWQEGLWEIFLKDSDAVNSEIVYPSIASG